jgi:hypothetical protein
MMDAGVVWLGTLISAVAGLLVGLYGHTGYLLAGLSLMLIAVAGQMLVDGHALWPVASALAFVIAVMAGTVVSMFFGPPRR